MLNKMFILVPAVFVIVLWLVGASKQSVAEIVGSEWDARINRCGAFVNPAACNAQRHCVWRGSCVPRS